MSTILIIESDSNLAQSLRKQLEREGHFVQLAQSVTHAKRQHFPDRFDLILNALISPADTGTEVLNMAKTTPVVMMTAFASLRSAILCIKLGAFDYLAKPFASEDLLVCVNAAIVSEHDIDSQFRSLNLLKQDNTPAAHANKTNANKKGGMMGCSQAMQTLFKRIFQVAPTDATVLIHGETGTGKELAAKSIHESSKRKDKALIIINCAAIPETLIESELFGHVKGAFTGATNNREGLVVAADGGTLFLDEIGELPMEAQARLLRVLQEGEVRPLGSIETRRVNIRLVAATHRDLKHCCQQGSFREDLYFRLNVIQLSIPPLRERGNDVIDLAETFIEKFRQFYNRSLISLSASAISQMMLYSWPGNVRELENAMHRAVILSEGNQEITWELLDLAETNSHSNTLSPESFQEDIINSAHDLSHSSVMETVFKRYVLDHQDRMNETQLAQVLGISRKCLWQRRKKLGIPKSRFGSEQSD